MDEDPLQYSRHARDRMREDGISEDEVEAIVWYPVRRAVSPLAVEHYGYADDGREFKIVTNRSETIVITVVDEEARRKLRRTKEMRRKQRRRWR
ncbi:MAG: DUF4258 domain-containing protein [Candidatus Eremiobacteraeota bacterium]|nr:DUF4258 domain-containing protein [Candidatus Eremiobacteraeota bacterium]